MVNVMQINIIVMSLGGGASALWYLAFIFTLHINMMEVFFGEGHNNNVDFFPRIV